MMNVKKIISLIMLLFMLLPLGAQNSEGKQRYKIAACDWMMLKRQKIGSFQLMKELGGDGIEMDMGGLGKRDTFDNKFHQPHFCKLFKETAQEQHIEVPSVAMSGFFGQSFLTHHNYKDWTVAGDARQELVSRLHEVGEMAVKDGVVIGIRTPLDAGGDIKLLKEINSKGIKIYYSFQNALENGRDLCKELKKLGKDRICQIHCTDTDGVTLPYNTRLDMNAVKHTLDKMGWSGWLVIERSRNKDEVRNVKKNFGTNVAYLKQIFQQEK